MPQDNFEKILQRIEGQQLPDLSQMDKHWSEMQQQLALATSVKSRPVVSILKWPAAAAVLLLAGFFAWKQNWFGANNLDQPEKIIASNNHNPVVTAKKDTVKKIDSIVISSSSPGLVNVNPSAVIWDTAAFSGNIFHNNSGAIKKDDFYAITNNNVSTLNYSRTDASTSIPDPKKEEAENLALMQQFWNALEKKPQVFNIDNRYDATIKGKEGTTIVIPANAFPNSSVPVNVELTEYYNLDGFVSGKLSTTSYGRQLQSDGMLYIKAMQNGQEIQMTGAKPMSVYMPARDRKENMQLFTGKWQEFAGGTKLMNWIAAGQNQDELLKKKLKFDEDDQGPEWVNAYSYRKKWFSKKVLVKYELGGVQYSISKAEIKKLIEHDNPDIIARVRKRSPGFELNWHDDNDYYSYRLPDSVIGFKGQTHIFSNSFLKDTITNAVRETIRDNYVFTLPNTGWFNCDRFVNDGSQKCEFAVLGNNENKIYCSFLLFEKYNSIFPGYSCNNKTVFRNIPLGENVTVITIGIKNGKTVCALKKLRTADYDISNLQFVQTDPEDFKSRLRSLNP